MREENRKILGIIPARGGSKSIPKKNLHLLAGKPLLTYVIEQAHLSRYVNRIVVSTDDPAIAAVAREYGAEVVMRPEELSNDTASSEAALLHTLDYLRESENYEPDIIVFMQCTSPLTLSEDIDGAVEVFLNEKADSALTVTPFHYFLWRCSEEGAVGINHDKFIRPLRQEREPQFLETGSIYVMRTAGFKNVKHRFFGKTVMYVIPQERCLEIDEPVDFLMAEVLLKYRDKEKDK